MNNLEHLKPIGWWNPDGGSAATDRKALKETVLQVRKPFYIVLKDDQYVLATGGTVLMGEAKPQEGTLPVVAFVPALPLENLGDRGFCEDYGTRYPYYAGSMAHGICSADIVENLANEGILAFFGAGGLPLKTIEATIDRLQKLGDKPYGFNLIHSPNEPKLEAGAVDLYIRKGMRLIEASAFLDITLPLVRFRVHGIHSDPSGNIVTPNRIIAKLSRVELATKFFAPPPEEMLQKLQDAGEITEEQANLARKIPMAQDVTAEGNSGGHTDNRPTITVIPSMLAIRDQMQSKHNFSQKLRVGTGGGIATPSSAAAAFSMGAAYIVTGSVNQACVESGTSDAVREALAQAQQADVVMAPAGDMFEMGVKVQVLKRGTMFPMRATKLSEIYNSCESIEAIPPAEKAMLEKTVFHASLEEIWEQTKRYFEERDNTKILMAEKNPKYKMALIFRWYLGQSSHWATAGKPERRLDYQIWCGPAMGAFNEWARGSFLEKPASRKVVTVALNLLHGAAVMKRLDAMKCQGLDIETELNPVPIEESELKNNLI